MTTWLDPLRRALHDHPQQPWFFRDDDAGWDDRRLEALTDTFRATGVHVDLAAIPAAVSPLLGQRLAEAIDDGSVSVHQHGWTHANHEPTGRKSEFGLSRGAAAQARDIGQGRRLLAERLGRPPTPIFVPPWNRCTDVTVLLLLRLGLTVLSADHSTPKRNLTVLREIPVTIDWTRAFSRGGRAALVAELSDAAATSSAAIGVMLHHAVMDEDELAALQELLALLAESSEVTLTSISSLVDESSLTSISLSGHGAPAR
jgi:predicted deacetylase